MSAPLGVDMTNVLKFFMNTYVSRRRVIFSVILVGWFLFGCSVAFASIVQLHTSHLWGTDTTDSVSSMVDPLLGHVDLDLLPEESQDPDDLTYPIQVIREWAWWRSAGTDYEKSRRMLWLAQARLKSGSEEYLEGDYYKGAQLMMKSKAYLFDAMLLADESGMGDSLSWQGELSWTVRSFLTVLDTMLVPQGLDDRELTTLLTIRQDIVNMSTSQGVVLP